MRKTITLLLLLNVLFFTFSSAVNANVGGDTLLNDLDANTVFEHKDFGTCLKKYSNTSSRFYCSGSVPQGVILWANLSDKSYIIGSYSLSGKPTSSGTSLSFYDSSGTVVKTYSGTDVWESRGSGGNKRYNGIMFTSDEGIEISFLSIADSSNYGKQGWNFNVEGIAPKPELESEQQSQEKNSDIAELCKKIDEILDELKKGNSCDVCSKLSAILADTDAINNNISQIKITTGYMNSHLGNISGKMDRLVANSADMREFVWDIRDAVIDSRDSLDRIYGNVNQLRIETERIGDDTSAIKTFVESIDGRAESIDNKLDKLDKLDELEGIRDGIDRIADDLTPTITPDFSAEIDKPDLPVLDIPTIENQEDTNTYFTEQQFEGEASPFPFAEGPKPWKNVDGKEIVIEDFDRDSPADKDKSLTRDESLESEKMDLEFIERDEPLQREKMDKDNIKRDEPLRRDESLEVEENLHE